MKKVSIVLALGSVLLAAPVGADENSDAIRKIVAPCESCHGSGGNSTTHSVPRLNGQQAAYIWQRLSSFRDPNTQTPSAIHAMWDIATHIPPDQINGIGWYFASQAPTTSRTSGQATSLGKKIYMEGAGATVPACQRCHGARGEGSGAVPRLAGQHADYLSAQLLSFNVRTRYHDKMDNNAGAMSLEQIEAVSEFLAGD
jgi:cytochrome c553